MNAFLSGFADELVKVALTKKAEERAKPDINERPDLPKKPDPKKGMYEPPKVKEPKAKKILVKKRVPSFKAGKSLKGSVGG